MSNKAITYSTFLKSINSLDIKLKNFKFINKKQNYDVKESKIILILKPSSMKLYISLEANREEKGRNESLGNTVLVPNGLMVLTHLRNSVCKWVVNFPSI